MTDNEIRALFLANGCPCSAALPAFNDYDRRCAEQLAANLTSRRDEDDTEYELSVEQELETEDQKYGQVWGE